MESREPRFMNDPERLEHALDLLGEAFSALCWSGCTPSGTRTGAPPARVQKAIHRLDKAMSSLEKHRDSAL